MLNFGFSEILIIALLALVVVGPERLPTMVRFLGRQYGKLMRASRELRRAFILEADRIEAEERAELLKQRKKEALERLQNDDDTKEDTQSVPLNEGTYIPFANPQKTLSNHQNNPNTALDTDEDIQTPKTHNSPVQQVDSLLKSDTLSTNQEQEQSSNDANA